MTISVNGRRWKVTDDGGKQVGRTHVAKGSSVADVDAWLSWYRQTAGV